MNYYYFRVSDRYGNQRSVTFNVRVDNHLTAYTEDEYGDHLGAATFHVAPNDTIELNVTVSADDMPPMIWKASPMNGQTTTAIPSKAPAPLPALSVPSPKVIGIISGSLTAMVTALM